MKFYAKLFFLFLLVSSALTVNKDRKRENRNGNTTCSAGNRKPVFMIHGIGTGAESLKHLALRISENNSNGIVFNTNAFENRKSDVSIWQQIEGQMGQEFRNFSEAHPGGFHCIGHSLGGLLCRALVETYPRHNVHNIVSIAGPMAGNFGIPPLFILEPFIDPIVPLLQYHPLLQTISLYMYQPKVQDTSAVANFWHDPTSSEQGYLKKNTFLPILDNEVPSERSESFKKAFEKLQGLIVLLSPDDESVKPWQSCEFSFWNENSEMVHYTKRRVYVENLFGLQTLDKEGKFIRHVIKGIKHLQWISDDELIDNYILPYLC